MLLVEFIVSIFNLLYLKIRFFQISSRRSSFLFTNATISNTSKVKITESRIGRTQLSLEGKNNVLFVQSAILSRVNIRITGDENEVHISEGAIIRDSNFIIRGNNCRILIGDRTTFGGVRIVNVGASNDIILGNDCMLSDNVEIWASDTHSIYDNEGNWINKEKSITIGNRVWIGSRAVILKGVSIGNDSIIGMASVVTKSVSNNTLVAGSPAKILKENISWNIEYSIRKDKL